MPTATTQSRTQEEMNVGAFRRLIAEGFSGGSPAAIDEILAPGHVEHQDGFEPPNREGVKQGIAFLHRLSPDLVVTVEDVAADGDKVWARLRARGTHGGGELGDATSRPFDITVMDLCRFERGRIVEHWGVADRLAQLQPLGLIPSPGGAGVRR